MPEANGNFPVPFALCPMRFLLTQAGAPALDWVYGPAAEKGRIAILRALLTATVTSLWCFAQFPEILRGMIFPRSVTKYRRILGFL